MTQFDDDAVDELMRLVGAELERMDTDVLHQSESMLAWIAQDLRSSASMTERARDERDADAFARRALARLAERRAERRLPRQPLRGRTAPVAATVAQSLSVAMDAGCAVMLELSAAAGSGRELWDEPCDTWVELPANLPSARYVAMRVDGDSMQPVLAPRDVILVQLDAVPMVDDLVVARRPEAGFVVKRVASLTTRQLELASFNDAYPPVTVRRDPSTVLGTVIARFSRG
jgi:phage repressor protein C with HTH and peptisase S24 domain